MSATAAAIAGVVFLVLAALHAYWALGGSWPGRDRESLARIVVGGPPGMSFPGRAATWAVVVVLLVGALVVLAAGGHLDTPWPSWTTRIAALTGGVVLLGRGMEGFFDTRMRPQTVGSPFVRLNTVLYSPLCLLLAALVTAAALGPSR